jgi:hypothetical protein
MNRTLYKSHFKNWCNEVITTSELEIAPRKVILRRFIEKGVIPFLVKKGYLLHGSEDELGNEIATGIYTGQFPDTKRNTEWHPEDMNYWLYKISTNDWMIFFNYWEKQLSELEDNQYLHASLIRYLWWQLNIPDSKNGQYIESMMTLDADEESEGETSNKKVVDEDPYMQDQNNTYNNY